MDYESLTFPYRRCADQDVVHPVRRPVVIVGAGPVGLSLAIDLTLQQIPVVLLDNDDRLSSGSRAICFAKRTLEIFDRLGCGERMTAKGVSWNVGRVYFRDEQVYQFDLLPEPGHRRPAFINLQQYYVEGFLLERCAELGVDIRWRNAVSALDRRSDCTAVTVDTPDGAYVIEADYLVACDGARSTVRRLLGLESHGRVFHDRFLIADVRMKAPFPPERWFWFDPPFHPNQSVLLHRQPDDVWRIDFQLGWDADPEEAKRPGNIEPRVRALLGPDVAFELVWASVYTFSCVRMDRFLHGRVVFAGDAAHTVSPFGARGANSGIQDAENLAWKLACVLRGQAPESLLETYGSEREFAADVNILNSTRSTDFITPKNEASRLFRDATLALAKHFPFARALVNSGRLSVPAVLADSPLNTPDADPFETPLVPGATAADAPVRRNDRQTWLLDGTLPGRFSLLVFTDDPAYDARALLRDTGDLAPVTGLIVRTAEAAPDRSMDDALVDIEGLARSRYDARPGTTYLLRPDQHVCARWRDPSPSDLRAALRRALSLDDRIAQ